MRRLIAFRCEGETLLGTLDEAPGATGLLIVSGGSEVRAGAHRGMALLAARLAAADHPVFRYDRRGVGDSTGEDDGWTSGGPDLRAAAQAFRHACPAVTTLVGLGNCDAAALLATEGTASGVDRLILSNPWVGADTSAGPPPAAVRARYARRLRDPAELRRLLIGGVNIPKLISGLRRVAQPTPPPPLAATLAAALPHATVILAEGDATAAAFRAAMPRTMRGTFANIRSDSHSFAGADDALGDAVLAALATR